MIFVRLLLLIVFCAIPVAAQDSNEDEYLTKTEAKQTERRLQSRLDGELIDVEQRLFDGAALTRRRIEQVEQRLDLSQRQTNAVLGIFAIILLLGFFFIASNLRARQQLSMERVSRVTRDSENLMHDIQQELNHPELEYLRISQMLRRLIRQLRSPDSSLSGAQFMPEMRAACNDPYLPASLYFMARILSAEHDGNWNIAVQMLDQLREMDASDPDVLLHLSHVHKNIAVSTTDREVRNRHQRLSYQYYAQFAAAMKSEEIRTDELQTDKLSPPPKANRQTPLEQEEIAPPAAKVKMPQPAKPAAQDRHSSIPPEAIIKPQTPAAQDRQSSISPEAIIKPQTPAAQDRHSFIPPEAIIKPKRQPERRPTAGTEVTITPLGTKPNPQAATNPRAEANLQAEGNSQAQTSQAQVENSPAQKPPPPPPPAQASQSQGAGNSQSQTPQGAGNSSAQTSQSQTENPPAVSLQPAANKTEVQLGGKMRGIRNSGGAAASAVGQGLKKSFGGIRSFIKVENNEPLPFLPVPAMTEIPPLANNSEGEMKLWGNISRADNCMAKAASAKSLRERNRLIDSAITFYTQAQAYNTNKTLYHNWGIALLAKALHVPEKKRGTLFNAAVDKFMAGNVVSPHYFDFHLASLYAIIGNKPECLKWLEIARESGNLDVESLMQAADFDAVRNEPWFDKFLET